MERKRRQQKPKPYKERKWKSFGFSPMSVRFCCDLARRIPNKGTAVTGHCIIYSSSCKNNSNKNPLAKSTRFEKAPGHIQRQKEKTACIQMDILKLLRLFYTETFCLCRLFFWCHPCCTSFSFFSQWWNFKTATLLAFTNVDLNSEAFGFSPLKYFFNVNS